MKKAKSGKERKKHVKLKIFFAIWIIASTLFFIKMGSSLMIEATYKDNYHYAVLNSPHNIRYQKKIYGIYKKHVEYLSNSNDEIISSYFSLNENYRLIILFIAVMPYFLVIGLIVDKFISKKDNSNTYSIDTRETYN